MERTKGEPGTNGEKKNHAISEYGSGCASINADGSHAHLRCRVGLSEGQDSSVECRSSNPFSRVLAEFFDNFLALENFAFFASTSVMNRRGKD